MSLTAAAFLAIMIVLSIFSALIVLAIVSYPAVRSGRTMAPFDRDEDCIAFLFDGDQMIDATVQGRRYLQNQGDMPDDLENMAAHFIYRFPELEGALTDLPEIGRCKLTGTEGSGQMQLIWHDGTIRMEIRGSRLNDRSELESSEIIALNRELSALRLVSDASPVLLWRQDAQAKILWANAAYLELARQTGPDTGIETWPPRLLFPDTLKLEEASAEPIRVSLSVPGEIEPRWYDAYAVATDEGIVITAVPASAVVKAENALQDFVQTLTKTFAHLTAGLAIFDKQRRLVLFNPAIIRLTSLKPEFLTSRPSLVTFLDRLRDKRMIPEPRDYKSWRQRIQELETAANEGTYEENWPLPNGQTYKVTGRPHPDGAIAFMFQDRSAEVFLARRYRRELEAGQAVLDQLEQAVSVFGPDGIMTLSNAKYRELWKLGPDSSKEPASIIDATLLWSRFCAPTPVWGDLREFAATFEERAEWAAEVRMRNGQLLNCTFSPIAGGATLVSFRVSGSEQLRLPPPNTKQIGQAVGES